MTADQFYTFLKPGDMCPVWVESWMDGIHTVAPTPFSTAKAAQDFLKANNPHATVDELALESDLAEVREWARTCPLEPIETEAGPSGWHDCDICGEHRFIMSADGVCDSCLAVDQALRQPQIEVAR
jgi:hypothetical protein